MMSALFLCATNNNHDILNTTEMGAPGKFGVKDSLFRSDSAQYMIPNEWILIKKAAFILISKIQSEIQLSHVDVYKSSGIKLPIVYVQTRNYNKI